MTSARGEKRGSEVSLGRVMSLQWEERRNSKHARLTGTNFTEHFPRARLPHTLPAVKPPDQAPRGGWGGTRWLVSPPSTALTAEPPADARRRPSRKSVLFKVSPGQAHSGRPQMIFKTIIVSRS